LPEVVTPWEVAAIRLRNKRYNNVKAAHSADGGVNFCVSSATMILRAEILRDPKFQYAFTHDFWMGQRQNTGDDNFITRWVLFGHLFENFHLEGNERRRRWKVGMQLTQEAQVGTSIMADSRFTGQIKRWSRSGLRHRLMCLLYEPGIRGMWQTCPFMTRKMVEGMLNPILVWIRLYSWFKTAKVYPRMA